MNWEYKVFQCLVQELEILMNRHGEQRWEAITVTITGIGIMAAVVMKRERVLAFGSSDQDDLR